MEGKSEGFSCLLIFAGYEIEYIVSLSHCFFLGLKFCVQQAYSEIHKIYVSQKLLHIWYIPVV